MHQIQSAGAPYPVQAVGMRVLLQKLAVKAPVASLGHGQSLTGPASSPAPAPHHKHSNSQGLPQRHTSAGTGGRLSAPLEPAEGVELSCWNRAWLLAGPLPPSPPELMVMQVQA